MSKNLTFKLIMDADNKGFVSSVKQSESVAKSVFDAIKTESDKLKQSSAEASKELGNIIPKGTSELAADLTKSLSSATEIIKDAGENAKSTADNFTDFGNKSHKALDLLKADLTSAKQKLQEFANSNASPADIEVAQRQVDQLEKEVQQADQAFNDFQAEVGRANTQLKETDSAATSAKKGLDGAKFAVNALVGAMAALGVGLGLRELAEAADSYTNLSARIKIATAEHGNFEQAMAGVHQVALATNSNLEATAGLFTKVNDVGKQMGMTQQQSLDLVKTINMAIQTGGGSAQASEAAITQFTQALQSGVLRGDEFNSIMEQAPGISKALAASLGVTTGELRKMAETGELSTEKVIKALQGQSAAIQAEYDQFPTTIGNALTKIATQWQILIGTMDQANGASATVAEWLVVIADNMGIVKTLIDDLGNGFVWVGDQLKKIDPSVWVSLKNALSSAYDAIKDIVAMLADNFITTLDILNTGLSTALSVLSSLTGEVAEAGEQVSFLERILQGLSIAFGFISDGAAAIKISINLLTGAMFDLASAANSVLAALTWGDLSKQFAANADLMSKKAKEHYAKADKDAQDFHSKGLQRLDEASKSQTEKDAESVASSKAKLEKLLADQAAEADGKKATEQEKLKAVQDYAEAAIKANGGVMDGTMQADLLTKGYIVTIDEAGKVSVQAGENAAQAAEKAKEKEEALKLAKENVKKADEELLAYQKQAAIERVLLDKQIEEAKRTGDLNALASAQSSINAINAKEAELANNRDLRVAELNKANTGSGQIAETAYSRASAAAKLFGVDLDASLNKVSKSFNSSGNDLNDLKTRLEEAGVTGKQAGDVTFQAWQKWAEQAKSQAEIDMAKAKLIEFEEQGVFSAKQVQMGMEYLDQVNGKLPDNISEVEKAYRLLGIASREEASKIADAQMKAFNVLKQSGTATAEQLKQALINMSDKIYASGDAAKISWYEGQLAANDLEASIDSTGKASVKAMDELTEANHRVKDSAIDIASGYQQAGKIIREEANAAQQAWNKTVQESKQAWDAEMKRQGQGLSAAISGYQSMSKNDVIAALKSSGMSESDARKKAGSIWAEAMAADRDAKFAAYGKGGNLAMNKLIEQEFNNAAAKGLTTQHGTNKINELLRNLDVRSTGSVPKVNDYAPSIPQPNFRDVETSPTKNVRFEFASGDKRFEMQGSQEAGDMMESILREFEMLKKAM